MAFFIFTRTQRLHKMLLVLFKKKNSKKLPDEEPDEPLESRAATPDRRISVSICTFVLVICTFVLVKQVKFGFTWKH